MVFGVGLTLPSGRSPHNSTTRLYKPLVKTHWTSLLALRPVNGWTIRRSRLSSRFFRFEPRIFHIPSLPVVVAAVWAAQFVTFVRSGRGHAFVCTPPELAMRRIRHIAFACINQARRRFRKNVSYTNVSLRGVDHLGRKLIHPGECLRQNLASFWLCSETAHQTVFG